VHLTVPELGALMLLFYVLFHYLRIFAATRAILALLGTVAIGTGGVIGRTLAAVGTWLANTGGAVTAWLFGSALVAVPFIIALVILVHDLHPKGGTASKRTGYVAFLVGASLSVGIAAIPALAPVRGAILSALSGITGFLNSL
jgi:hypothetical protein